MSGPIWMTCDVMVWRPDVRTSRDVTLWRHVTSNNEFWRKRTRKYPTREVHERSGVFILERIGGYTPTHHHVMRKAGVRSRLCIVSKLNAPWRPLNIMHMQNLYAIILARPFPFRLYGIPRSHIGAVILVEENVPKSANRFLGPW